jgi:hypothetical protein
MSANLLFHMQYFEKIQAAIQGILSREVQQISVEIFQFQIDS